MACVSKIGSLYELVTKNVVVTTTNTIFGINPRIWLSLPCEGLLLLKIRQVVPTTGETLPVQIAIPANSTVSTVGDDTCCPVTGVAVVNPINVAVTGAAMVNNTERLVYFNKVRGVLRLMDCCVPTTSASASETTVDEGSRRSDGTYMGYGGGIYDHYGKEHDGRMDELERRERDLERRERELERDERELEKRERLHEREDEMYRRGWFGERGIRDECEGTEPYMRRGRRSRYY